MKKTTIITIDSREPPEMWEILRALKIPFKVEKLEVGDYATNECIFERKTVDDFVMSIRGFPGSEEPRIFEQINDLVDYCNIHERIPWLLISGDFSKVKERISRYGAQLNVEAVFGALASLPVRYPGLSIIWNLAGDAELVYTMYKIAEKVAEGKYGIPHRRVLSRTHSDKRIALIADVCRVSPKIAEKLFKKFGGLRGVLLADPKELYLIDGVGPVTIARIQALLGE